MELLKFFGGARQSLKPLPKGSFTIDCEGRVLASTLPHSFPTELSDRIAREVQRTFKSSVDAQIRVGEFIVRYSNLKITARELRGAIIFLTPQTLQLSNN